MVLRLLFFSPVLFGLSSSVVGASSGDAVVAFASLFAIMTAASAAAFFRCSQASHVLSATYLPAATHLGFFVCCAAVVGVGVVVVACCVISCVLSDCSVDILKQKVC